MRAFSFFHLAHLALQGRCEIRPGHDQAFDIHFEPGIPQIAGDGLCLILKVFSYLEHNVEISILGIDAK